MWYHHLLDITYQHCNCSHFTLNTFTIPITDRDRGKKTMPRRYGYANTKWRPTCSCSCSGWRELSSYEGPLTIEWVKPGQSMWIAERELFNSHSTFNTFSIDGVQFSTFKFNSGEMEVLCFYFILPHPSSTVIGLLFFFLKQTDTNALFDPNFFSLAKPERSVKHAAPSAEWSRVKNGFTQ